MIDTKILEVIKNRRFLKLWGCQLFSVSVANLLNFVLIGKIFEATGSSIALGFLWGFYVFPTVVLGPFSGVILDYLNKKSILFYSSFLQAFVVLLYIGVGTRIFFIYTILLLYSFCDEFIMPAVAVLLPSVVTKKELPVANSIFLFTNNGSIILGFIIGGLMVKLLGYSDYIFMLSSALLFAAAALSALIKWEEPKDKKKLDVGFYSFFQELTEGYRFIKSETKVLFPMLLLAGLQVVTGMGLILLPSYSREIINISFADSSYFVLVPAVFGALFGSLMVERLLRNNLKRVLVINGLFALGAAIFFAGFFLPKFDFRVILGVATTLAMGISFVLVMVPLQILIQENTPFGVRGRVFGTLNTLITVAAAIPVFLTATIIDAFGVKLVMGLTGVGIILLSIYARRGRYGILANHHRT